MRADIGIQKMREVVKLKIEREKVRADIGIQKMREVVKLKIGREKVRADIGIQKMGEVVKLKIERGKVRADRIKTLQNTGNKEITGIALAHLFKGKLHLSILAG